MILDARAARLDRYWKEWERFSYAQSEKRMKVLQTQQTQFKVSDFVGWQRDKTLVLSPNFQRRSVWKKGAKSYLIDTIMRGLPIPIIFLRERATDLKTFKATREVVDGQQRLRTLISFIAPTALSDFSADRDDFRIKPSHNKEFGGKSFADLPADTQQQILDYQFSVHNFPADTADEEIFQIFARMNATGLRLNAQELRNAEFFGEFKSIALKLASEQLQQWRDWHIFTPDNLSRMDEVELTSELMILILQGISEKSERVISNAYEKYEEVFKDGPEVAKRLRQIFETIGSELKTEVTTHFSKRTLFYALFAAVYEVQYGLITPQTYESIDANKSFLSTAKAAPLKQKAVEKIRAAGIQIADKTAPEAVMDAITRRTTHVRERRSLVKYLL
jgi:hypothetical protein